MKIVDGNFWIAQRACGILLLEAKDTARRAFAFRKFRDHFCGLAHEYIKNRA